MPEITFCKDCMHYLRTGYGQNKKCYRPCKGGNGGLKMKPYDFCSYGTTWDEYEKAKAFIAPACPVSDDEAIEFVRKRLNCEQLSWEDSRKLLYILGILIRAKGGRNADL